MSAANKVLNMLKLKTWLTAGILGSAALLMAACGGNKPEDVSVQFSKYIWEGNAEKMLELIHTGPINAKEKELLLKVLQQTCEYMNKTYAEYGGPKDVVSTEVEGDCQKDGGICVVTLRTTFNDGQSSFGESKVINVGGEYKILFI